MSDPFEDLENQNKNPDPFLLILERCKRDPDHLLKSETDFDLVLRVYEDIEQPDNLAKLLERFSAVEGLDIEKLQRALLLKAIEKGEEKAVREAIEIGLNNSAELLKPDIAAAFVALYRAHAVRWGYLVQSLRDAKVRRVSAFQKAIEAEAKKAPPPKPAPPSSPVDVYRQSGCVMVYDGPRPGLYNVDKEGQLDRQLSQKFTVRGIGRSPAGSGKPVSVFGIVVDFANRYGRDDVLVLNGDLLNGEASKLGVNLYGRGFLHDSAETLRRALQRYWANFITPRLVDVAPKTGWMKNLGFVYLDEFFPYPGVPHDAVVLDPAATGPRIERRGRLNGVAALLGKHAYGVWATSGLLSGPLLELADDEGGGYCGFGSSSGLKSWLERAAGTVAGSGARTGGFTQSFASTAGGVEGMLRASNDLPLSIDDTSSVEDPRVIRALVFMAANGSGKARMRADISMRETPWFRVFLRLNGEVPTQKILTDAKIIVRGGFKVRMIDVPAQGRGRTDNTSRGAALDATEEDPTAFIEKLSEAMREDYGHALPEFIRRLIAEEVTGGDVKEFIKEFIACLDLGEVHGQIERVVRKFALTAVAGELAIALGVLPWAPGSAAEAAKYFFGLWRNVRKGDKAAEVEDGLTALQKFFEQNSESRFDEVDERGNLMFRDKPVARRVGFVQGKDLDRRWIIPVETLKDLCPGVDLRALVSELANLGAILTETDKSRNTVRTTVKVTIEGRRPRYYVFTTKIFEVVSEDGE
jgi:hypothetical protein